MFVSLKGIPKTENKKTKTKGIGGKKNINSTSKGKQIASILVNRMFRGLLISLTVT